MTANVVIVLISFITYLNAVVFRQISAKKIIIVMHFFTKDIPKNYFIYFLDRHDDSDSCWTVFLSKLGIHFVMLYSFY